MKTTIQIADRTLNLEKNEIRELQQKAKDKIAIKQIQLNYLSQPERRTEVEAELDNHRTILMLLQLTKSATKLQDFNHLVSNYLQSAAGRESCLNCYVFLSYKDKYFVLEQLVREVSTLLCLVGEPTEQLTP